jgi:hypothetical protein
MAPFLLRVENTFARTYNTAYGLGQILHEVLVSIGGLGKAFRKDTSMKTQKDAIRRTGWLRRFLVWLGAGSRDFKDRGCSS